MHSRDRFYRLVDLCL